MKNSAKSLLCDKKVYLATARVAEILNVNFMMLDWGASKGWSGQIGGSIALDAMKGPKKVPVSTAADSPPPTQTFISVNSAVSLFKALQRLKRPGRYRPEVYTHERADEIFREFEAERTKALSGRNLVSRQLATYMRPTPAGKKTTLTVVES